MQLTKAHVAPVARFVTRLRRVRRLIVWMIQLCLIALSALVAFSLRFEFRFSQKEWSQLFCATLVWMLVKPVAYWLFQVDRSSWRYASTSDVFDIISANIAASMVSVVGVIFFAGSGFPRSIYVLDFAVCVLTTAGCRLLVRHLVDYFARTGNRVKCRRILIYGAGAAGIAVLRGIRSNPRLAYFVCGFIDDDPLKQGVHILEARVHGSGQDLAVVRDKYAVDEVLIAIPSAMGTKMTQILQRCHEAGLPCKTIPRMSDIIEGPGMASQIRDVAVDDLLGPTPVQLDSFAIRRKIERRVVLVTGAGGSIGSELCRQIARFQPAAIVGYEIAESSLFHIEQEMKRAFPQTRFYPEIGSIQNARRLAEVFDLHRPSIIFHAAAYKHVPLMAAHAFEVVENNVFGTLNITSAAADFGAEDFVLISSDKAAHPANFLGATKRVAELVIRSLQSRARGVKYITVRFGNLLGRNGSVVPIFKEQIARGGPVKVSHPEMRRFFLTIPDAAQLALQASTLGRGGEVFVLDAGQSVRIVDLARNLILLSGLRPDDIKIEFTGLRAGEKLYEEIRTIGEGIVATPHEQIKAFGGTLIPWGALEHQLKGLQSACETRDFDSLMVLLKELVPDYNPSAEVVKKALRPSVGNYATVAQSVGSLQ